MFILYRAKKYDKTMTTTEFKIEYPQYSHLENDDLWDKMTEVLLQSDNVLIADPNQVKTYNTHVLDILQDDGTYKKSTFQVEFGTRWLNSKGEEIVVKENKSFEGSTSYRFEIIDFSKL